MTRAEKLRRKALRRKVLDGFPVRQPYGEFILLTLAFMAAAYILAITCWGLAKFAMMVGVK